MHLDGPDRLPLSPILTEVDGSCTQNTLPHPHPNPTPTTMHLCLWGRYPIKRSNGSHIQFNRNACVLLSEKGVPLGNRIKAMLSYEFLKPRWARMKMLSKRLF